MRKQKDGKDMESKKEIFKTTTTTRRLDKSEKDAIQHVPGPNFYSEIGAGEAESSLGQKSFKLLGRFGSP